MVDAMVDFSPLMDALQLTNDRRPILFSGLSSGVRASVALAYAAYLMSVLVNLEVATMSTVCLRCVYKI